MLFTSLHRYLGEPPGPFHEGMLTEAMTQSLPEAADLDWKSRLPQQKALAQSDLPKDLAAMANSGGGTLVFGVTEAEKRATGREDAGDFDERYERTLRRVMYTAISPPLTGLHIELIEGSGPRAVVVVVPDSPDAPHLVYQNHYFGAPVRNDSDTEWMNERALEAAYKTRFNAAADASERLAAMYDECVRAHDPADAATLIAVARPRHSRVSEERGRGDIGSIMNDALVLASRWTAPKHPFQRSGVVTHPLHGLDVYRPRRGLKRWTALPFDVSPTLRSHGAVHDDGCVTMGWAAGGGPKGESSYYWDREITSGDLECFVADFFALVRTVAATGAGGDMEILIGLEWRGKDHVVCREVTSYGRSGNGSSAFGGVFARVGTVVRPSDPDDTFYDDVRAIATDCINQFGIGELAVLRDTPLEH